MAISSHGTTFAFVTASATFAGRVTSISIEEAQPEIVDMTDVGDLVARKRMMATGDVLTPPKVSIDYMRQAGDLTMFPVLLASESNLEGQLTIASPSFTVSEQAVLDSASTEMAVGDVIRGKMSFTITRINY